MKTREPIPEPRVDRVGGAGTAEGAAKWPVQIFTLIEVLVAVAILSISLVGMLGICSSAADRLRKAAEKREHQHMLSQASEYYLLAGQRETIPQEFFPFPGYHSKCLVMQPELPPEVEDQSGQWRFVKLKISIHSDEDPGTEIMAIEIEKILRAEDVD
ncbi:MAG: type II secretion system protein [Victivallales bacterium]|nr:type II secretion system protein [Victivallales bacterium]